MKNRDKDCKEWLRKANENLEGIRSWKKNKKISNEKICIEAHEAVEFALKGLMTFLEINIERTHSIRKIIDLIQNNGYKVPDEIQEAERLTYYVTDTKYPGNYDEVSREEMKNDTRLAKKVVKWVEKITEDKNILFK